MTPRKSTASAKPDGGPGPTDDEGPLLSPAQLAERWFCSEGYLANKRSEGTSIPFLRLLGGRRIAYRLRDVLAAEAHALVLPVPPSTA